MTSIVIIAALLLDALLGEPRHRHPLVGFGYVVRAVERFTRTIAGASSPGLQAVGMLSWLVLVAIPAAFLALLLDSAPFIFDTLLGLVVLYLCIGGRSLAEHARAIAQPLAQGDIAGARKSLSFIVSRDTEELNDKAIARATVESVLENGSDAVLAPIFWFAVFGPAGALAYRLTNTLDAMWGYRTERYQDFGRAAARLDDVLNYFPARFCALSYALVGHIKPALRSWRRQAHRCDSPNAGVVMATGAGALFIRIGGSARYQGQRHWRPILGEGPRASVVDIERAVELLWRATACWCVVILMLELCL